MPVLTDEEISQQSAQGHTICKTSVQTLGSLRFKAVSLYPVAQWAGTDIPATVAGGKTKLVGQCKH